MDEAVVGNYGNQAEAEMAGARAQFIRGFCNWW